MTISKAFNKIIRRSCFGLGFDDKVKECSICPMREECQIKTKEANRDICLSLCKQLHKDVNNYLSAS